MVHPHLKRREQRQKGIPIDYPSPELEGVLERTLGVPFQEQATQIAITAAGFEPAEADQLRRAMATFKRTGTIGNFEQRFIDGMVSKKYLGNLPSSASTRSRVRRVRLSRKATRPPSRCSSTPPPG